MGKCQIDGNHSPPTSDIFNDEPPAKDCLEQRNHPRNDAEKYPPETLMSSMHRVSSNVGKSPNPVEF